MKRTATALALALLAACTTPATFTTAPLKAYDKDTDYAIEAAPDGFTISVVYGRYQFFPETSAILATCRSQLTALAHEEADRRGRKLQPIDEQRIRVSTGRNATSGITSCSANVRAFYAG